jgi:DNA repair protein RadD
MILRTYQEDAIAAVYQHLRSRDDNPVVVIPTAGGKTPIIATICSDAVTKWQGRVLIVSHVKELLSQAVDKLKQVAPDLDVGIYSAGLKRRDTQNSVVVAGIQSVYQRAGELDAFDLILIDECHLLPREGEGMYRTFLRDAQVVNPHVRTVGFTATPYRLDAGPICAPDHFLNAVCYEIGVRELIRDGYLCPLVTRNGQQRIDTSDLHVRGGEFVAGEVEELMDRDELVEAACAEIIGLTRDRNAVLIFAAGVAHGMHIQRVLENSHDVECGFVCGETPTVERDELLIRFRRDATNGLFPQQPFKYLCNVGVLTTGFDAPIIDCVVLLRPTMSPVLYSQMVGRGFRLHPEKANTLVLDFGGNILRHGPIDQIRIEDKPNSGSDQSPAKECPICHAVIATGYATCPDCGHQFPPPEQPRHDANASNAGILSGDVTDAEYEILDINYSVHKKRDAAEDAPRSMRVDYRLGLDQWQSEWICFEHTGYARQKAAMWWQGRSPVPIPDTASEAVALAEAGVLAVTDRIIVRNVSGERFDRIVGYQLGPLPEQSPIWDDADLEEVPF